MTDYHATDDDLPEFFWREASTVTPPVDGGNGPHLSSEARAAAVMLHYPEIQIKAAQRNRREASIRSDHDVSLSDKKVFVKLSKKVQMWDWLRGLFEPEIVEKVSRENNANVMVFLTKMYAKFYRYSPHKCKWVTQKQYEWLRHIACHYLKVPNE